jgi:hypothetical protein
VPVSKTTPADLVSRLLEDDGVGDNDQFHADIRTKAAGHDVPIEEYYQVAAWIADSTEPVFDWSYDGQTLTVWGEDPREVVDQKPEIYTREQMISHGIIRPAVNEEDKKYPNSAQGALMMLQNDSQGLNLKGATVKPDPSVQGVWKVSLTDGKSVIVYLAGHADPFGRIRSMNDFEVNEPRESR